MGGGGVTMMIKVEGVSGMGGGGCWGRGYHRGGQSGRVWVRSVLTSSSLLSVPRASRLLNSRSSTILACHTKNIPFSPINPQHFHRLHLQSNPLGHIKKKKFSINKFLSFSFDLTISLHIISLPQKKCPPYFIIKTDLPPLHDEDCPPLFNEDRLASPA